MGLRRGPFYRVSLFSSGERTCICVYECRYLYGLRARSRENPRDVRGPHAREGRRKSEIYIYKRRNNGLQNAPVALYTFAYRVPCVRGDVREKSKAPTFLPSFPSFAMHRFSSSLKFGREPNKLPFLERNALQLAIEKGNIMYFIIYINYLIIL